MSSLIKEGQSITGLLADNVRLGVFSESADLLTAPVEAVLNQDNVQEVVVFGGSGNPLLSRCQDSDRDSTECGKKSEELWKNLLLEIRQDRGIIYKQEGTQLVFAGPVLTAAALTEELYFYGEESAPVEREILGFTAVTFSTQGVEKTQYHILIEGLLVTAVFLLLVCFATFFIVRAVFSPLNKLVNQVRTSDVQVDAPDDIGLLHESFTLMIEQLSESFATITGLKKDLENLTTELLKTQEIERQKLAFELHDNVAQELSSLKIYCGSMARQWPEAPPPVAEELAMMIESLKRCIDTVRALSYDLRPAGLCQLGLARTVGQLCTDFAEAADLEIDYLATGFSNSEPEYNISINCYRIIQEALNNIKHHARASRVEVRLIESYPGIILRIKDNGAGFNVSIRKEEALAERRMGLKNMEKRATLLGGTMSIESHIGKGTRVLVELPFTEKADEEIDTRQNDTDS